LLQTKKFPNDPKLFVVRDFVCDSLRRLYFDKEQLILEQRCNDASAINIVQSSPRLSGVLMRHHDKQRKNKRILSQEQGLIIDSFFPSKPTFSMDSFSALF